MPSDFEAHSPWGFPSHFAAAGRAPEFESEGESETGHKLKVPVRFQVEKYVDAPDVDAYRAAYGKAEGEARWFAEHRPTEIIAGRENLLLIGGASILWEALIGNAPTYFTNANACIGVGDSTTAATCTQTDLAASSNKARQAMDSTFPTHADGTAGKAITGATNATPIAITATSHGFSTNDWVQVSEVGGNTASNGVWQITVSDANTFSLNGSTGNGSYTASTGVAAKSSVIVFQATFGTSAANFHWEEWGLFNASSSGRMLNRKVIDLGTKTSAASWAFKVAMGLV